MLGIFAVIFFDAKLVSHFQIFNIESSTCYRFDGLLLNNKVGNNKEIQAKDEEH